MEGHKTGGRTKGIPNKRTLILRDVLDQQGIQVPKMLLEILPTLSPEKQADVLLNLMQYLYPKRKAIELQEAPPLNEQRATPLQLSKLSCAEVISLRDIMRKAAPDATAGLIES